MSSNPRKAKRQQQIRIFNALIGFCAVFARVPKLKPISDFLLRRLADFTYWMRNGQQQNDLTGLAKEWQRMFPSRAFVPIKQVTAETAFAEIHGVCPVTASGDVHACHRLMEYDRHLLKKMGGQFVVLDSKANPTVPICMVAIRMKAQSIADLTPAHTKSAPQ
ncbi:MAG: hypothetical protein U0V18_16525 [Anaerolineales bacterium]